MSGADTDRRIGRREFLAGAAGAVTALTAVRPSAVRGAEANSKLQLGIIGSGGRGKWIGRLFEENSNTKVVAVHDYFRDRVDDVGNEFDVPESHRFTGLSGYRDLVESDLDAVAIESPPYFHPEQTKAVVEAGKHVYLAKPMAVDVPGCRTILECGERARGKLSFLVDFQTRNNPIYREAVSRVHDGAIGVPVCGQVYYHTGRLGRRVYEGDTEARLRNWVFDIPLSGDIIVEQNIHVVDVACWLLDAHPRRATGTGGRKARTDVGDCWDHFVVTYSFPHGVLMDFSSGQFTKGYNDLCVRLFGTVGTTETHYGGDVWIAGDNPYPGGNTGSIFRDGAVNNIKDFCASIESGKLLSNVEESVRSNLASILGRTAAYRHGTAYWDEIMQANERLDAGLGELEGG